ncbi:hypothetical protein RJT34_12808 [Clitoria ternatea]|uniref:Uncharacterized protein n=1 Tax=Clitoria ternatea TaxID=43366 RepID=A0AAN9JPI7_CLITE
MTKIIYYPARPQFGKKKITLRESEKQRRKAPLSTIRIENSRRVTSTVGELEMAFALVLLLSLQRLQRGLILGVELVTDRELKTPAKAKTLHVMDQMKAGKMRVRLNLNIAFCQQHELVCVTYSLFSLFVADFLADAMDLSLSSM